MEDILEGSESWRVTAKCAYKFPSKLWLTSNRNTCRARRQGTQLKVLAINRILGRNFCTNFEVWFLQLRSACGPCKVFLLLFIHSVMSDSMTPWTAAWQASLSFAISWSLLKLMSFELVMPSNHLILCCPLLRLSIFPSIRVCSNESAFHIRWPKYWRFSFSLSPSNEYPELISFRIDSFDLLAVQGTLKSFL